MFLIKFFLNLISLIATKLKFLFSCIYFFLFLPTSPNPPIIATLILPFLIPVYSIIIPVYNNYLSLPTLLNQLDSLNNTLTGNSGNNTLNGGTGDDTMVGGTGDDTYTVDSTSDVVTENSSQGTDLIQSSITFTAIIPSAIALTRVIPCINNNIIYITHICLKVK